MWILLWTDRGQLFPFLCLNAKLTGCLLLLHICGTDNDGHFFARKRINLFITCQTVPFLIKWVYFVSQYFPSCHVHTGNLFLTGKNCT